MLTTYARSQASGGQLDRDELLQLLGECTETITLFVTINDDNGAGALENESAEVLNPPTVFNRFITRYE